MRHGLARLRGWHIIAAALGGPSRWLIVAALGRRLQLPPGGTVFSKKLTPISALSPLTLSEYRISFSLSRDSVLRSLYIIGAALFYPCYRVAATMREGARSAPKLAHRSDKD